MKNEHAKTINPNECLDDLRKLLDAYQDFLADFEIVFGNDWDLTKDRINDDAFVAGTFIEPNVPDESDNWANRGSLLASYRALKALIKDS